MTANAGEPEGFEPDWDRDLAEIQRRMRLKLRGVNPDDVEDCSQEAARRLVRFTQRMGRPSAVNGLIEVIVQRVADSYFRALYVRNEHLELVDSVEELPDQLGRELLELEEQAKWRSFLVISYYEANDSPCVELAEAKARDEDLKRLAERTGRSHDMLRKRWSRCAELLRDAIDKGRLPWTAPWNRRRP